MHVDKLIDSSGMRAHFDKVDAIMLNAGMQRQLWVQDDLGVTSKKIIEVLSLQMSEILMRAMKQEGTKMKVQSPDGKSTVLVGFTPHVRLFASQMQYLSSMLTDLAEDIRTSDCQGCLFARFQESVQTKMCSIVHLAKDCASEEVDDFKGFCEL